MKFVLLALVPLALATPIPANKDLRVTTTGASASHKSAATPVFSTIAPTFTPTAPTFKRSEDVKIMFNDRDVIRRSEQHAKPNELLIKRTNNKLPKVVQEYTLQ